MAGPDWEVRTVVPPGVSAHVFEPEPSDVRRLAPARLVVVVGAGYDDWVGKMVAACASVAGLHDVSASLGIRAEPGAQAHREEHDEGEHDHEHGDVATDPHWWLAPATAARAPAPIAAAFARVDPAGAERYRERAAALEVELLRLDRQIEDELRPHRGRSFVAAHAAWTHFAERYDLRMAATIEPAPGREPSPRELKTLIDSARTGGYGVLFTEPQFPLTAARVVAADAGLALQTVDPIGGVAGRSTYAETMRFNAAAFARGFSLPRGRS